MVQSVDYNAITINDRMESKMKNLLTIKNINDLSNTQIVDALFGAIQDGVLSVGFESAEDYCVIADDAKIANIIETCTIDCKKEDCAQFLKSFDETLAKLSQVKTDKITGTFSGEVSCYIKRLCKLIELGAPQILIRNEQISLLIYSFLNEYTLLRDIDCVG